MSQFDKHFAQSGASLLAGYFGDQVTYTPPAGSTSTADVCLNYVTHTKENRERRYTEDGVFFVTTRDFVLICDATHGQFCGLENPQSRGQITFDGVTYVIEVVTDSNTSDIKRLKCTRHEAAAVVRDEYYRKS